MSLSSAVHNAVYLRYLIMVLSLLVAAGAVLLFLRMVLRKDVSSMLLIYRSWWIMAPIILAAIAMGRVSFILLVMVLAMAGFKEFARATGLYNDRGMTIAVYSGIAAMTAIALMRDPFTSVPGWFGMFRTLPVYVVALILLIPIVRNKTRGQLQAMALAIIGFIYLGWMFGHAGFLANSDHPYGYLLYLIVAVEINDVAAFTFGKIFGRRPFRSEISPKKTWEGSIGAFAVSMALPWVLAFSFPHFGPLQKVLTGLIVGAGGQLGDLAISVIKRDIGIKDMGAAIPGHGGILDRIDSLIYTAPLFCHMINFFYGLQGQG